MRSLLVLLLLAVAVPAVAQPPRDLLSGDADRNDWEAYYNRGVAILQSGGRSEAETAFYWASRLAPTRAEPLYARWVAFHLKNIERWTAYENRDPQVLADAEVQRADSLFFAALVRNPFVHRGLSLLLYDELPGDWRANMVTFAFLEYANGKNEEAVRDYRRAIGRGSDSFFARNGLTQALVSLQRFDDARQEMDSLVAALERREARRVVVYESKEMLHYSIGLLQLASSRPAEARAAMEQAQVENAAEWFPHRGRAVALVAEGRTQEAVEEYRTALEKAGGNDAMLLFELGEALSAVGQHAEAADQFRKVAQLEPFWADVFVALGNEELQAGRAPEALAAYERYLPLAPRTAATTVAAVQRQIATLKR